MDLYDKGVVKVTGDTVMLSHREEAFGSYFRDASGCVVGLLGLSWFNLDSDRCSRAYTRERLNIVERPTPNITGTGEADFVALADGGGTKSDCNSIVVRSIGESAGLDNGAGAGFTRYAYRCRKVDLIARRIRAC